MYTTNLGGYSGCRVLLCEDEQEHSFVRKVSSSKEYNNRLKAQAEKQTHFQSDLLQTPKILAEGYTEEGLYYFDMEYIQGITLAENLKTMEVGKIRPIVKKIFQAVMEERTFALPILSETIPEASILFHSKIENLRQTVIGKSRNIEKAIELLSGHDWSYLTWSKCHGDMTLENIMMKDSQLYLIDFLDSFYDSYILDIAALLQDCLTLWYYRREDKINNNTLVRLIIFKDILADALNAVDERLWLEVCYALLLKLMRIYPYAVDYTTCSFLEVKTREVIAMIQEVEK